MAATESAIEDFQSRITGRRVTEQTANKYGRWVKRFEMWRGDPEPDIETLIDFDTILADEDWKEYPWENKTGRRIPDAYAYRSRNVALSAAKLWCRIHHGNEIIEEVQNIVSGEPAPFDPPYISKNDVEAVFDTARDDCDVSGCEAALRLTYDAIMRAVELTSVKREDIDFDQGTIYVRAAKGSDNAEISLSGETLGHLRQYIETEQPGGTVFKNSYDNGWGASSWCSHVRNNHHEVGAHSFGRHTPIIHRLNDGEPFGDVYRRARHSNPAMTARYARVVGVEIPDWADD